MLQGRRRFLLAGSAVAGAVWVAPALTSAAAAAPGTCAMSVLDWADFTAGAAPPSPTTVDGVEITQTYSTTGTAPSTNSYQINSGTSGNRSPYLRLGWGGAGASNAAAGSTQQLVFAFDQAVTGVCFTLTDIDAQTNTWQDFVEISATGPGAQTISSTLPNGAFVQGTNPWNGDLADGDAGSGTEDGNVDVVIAGQVDTFTVLYTSAPFNATASQHIGIFNPQWCTV